MSLHHRSRLADDGLPLRHIHRQDGGFVAPTRRQWPTGHGPLATAIPMFRNDLPMASDPEHFPYGPPETSIRPPAARP